jgi:dipeptidase E
MKYLLTSGGISNDSIRNAQVEPLGKLIAESSAPPPYSLSSQAAIG